MRIILAAIAACVALTALLLQPTSAQGYQPPDLAVQRAAIDRLAPMLGEWRGEVAVSFPEPMTVYQHERVERDLSGLTLVIHGTGYAEADYSGEPVFEAMAVISFNEQSGLYEVRSYSGGHAVTARGEFLDDGRFRWSFAGGPMQFRYTATFSDGAWHEVGELSRDGGASWMQTIAMNLTPVS